MAALFRSRIVRFGLPAVLLLAALAFWLAGREQTLQWSLQKALAGSGVTATGVEGSWYGPIRIARLSYRTPERNIVAENIELRISQSRLFSKAVAIEHLKIKLLSVEMLAASKEKPVLPADLSLPMALTVDDAQLEKIVVAAQGNRAELDAARFTLAFDAHSWQLKNVSAGSAWGALNAALRLDSKRPFALQGRFSLQQKNEKRPAILAQVQGHLGDLTIASDLNMQEITGTTTLRLMPFEPQPLRSARIDMKGIDPARMHPSLPPANFSVELDARMAPDGVIEGTLAAINHAAPASLDNKGLPLRQARMQLAGTLDALQMNALALDLGKAGLFTGKAGLRNKLVAMRLHTDNLNLKGIDGKLRATRIAGDIVLDAAAQTQTLRANLAQGKLRLEVDATLADKLLQVRQARLRAGSSDVRLNGQLQTDGQQQWKAEGNVARFNPAEFGAYPRADLNADFHAQGRLAPGWQLAADYTLRPSRLFNQSLSGRGTVAADAQRVHDVDATFKLGANVLAARGSFGAPQDKLEWHLDAPQLAAIGPGFEGALKADGFLAGVREHPQLSFSLDAHGLTLFEHHHVKSIRASAQLAQGEPGQLQAEIDATDIESAGVKLQTLHAAAGGTRAAHNLKIAAKGEAIDASAELAGGWQANRPADGWSGRLVSLQNRGRFALALTAPATLQLSSTHIAIGEANLKLQDGMLKLQSFDRQGNRISTRGQLRGLPLDALAQLSPALAQSLRENVDTDLRLGASWSLDVGQSIDGNLRVYREAGDITMHNDLSVALGLDLLEARADIADGKARAQFDMRGTRLGAAHFEASTQLAQIDGKWRLPAGSPLTAKGTGRMTSIAWMSMLLGQPGLDLGGTLGLDMSASGTIGAPSFKGQLSGDQLALTWADEGVKLRNGRLRAHLEGDRLMLEQLHFDGEQGTAELNGWLRYADSAATMQLKLVADKLQVISRPDRVLVASAQGSLSLDKKRLQLDGKIKAERASIELQDKQGVTFSDDVVVLGAPPKQAKSAAIPFFLDLDLDLGDNFSLKGKGIDAQLGGTLQIKSIDNRVPRAIGGIRVVKGTYTAYGQRLQIERGLIDFTGPLDNPGLNILALRKKPEFELQDSASVEVGVEVRGTALAPTAKLVSTPPLPDSEKLAWLVLGHGMEGTGGKERDLLGLAAGALFGGKQSDSLQKLGLDEVGMSRAKGLEGTVFTVGKRISSRAYITYEQGASTTTTLVKLRYALSKRLSLQAQSGSNNAIDLLYTWVFD